MRLRPDAHGSFRGARADAAPGANDMAYLRAKDMQCYGVGPLTDSEDGPKGFGAHSDQERILESSLHTFVKFHWDIVVKVAGR